MMAVWWVILKYDDSMVSYIKEWWQFDEFYQRRMTAERNVWWIILKNYGSMVSYTS